MSEQLGTQTELDYDVVVVGGGPAGCSAGVFTARYGLDTAVFDRGRSSIQRCAYLENYLGFPAGIDIEMLYELMHDHAETAGCDLVSELVESVEARDAAQGFLVTTQEEREVTARRVIAATRYDGEYLRGLDADEAMFETRDHDDEEHEYFDRSYADHDGRTQVDGLYVASPSKEADRQAIMAAGRGGRVAHTVLTDAREARGFPDDVSSHYDWVRREAERSDEWSDPDRWRQHFDERTPDDHEIGENRYVALRDAEVDRRLDSYVGENEIDRRGDVGQERLAARLDDEVILAQADLETSLEAVDDAVLIDAVDDRAIVEAARDIEDESGTNEVSP